MKNQQFYKTIEDSLNKLNQKNFNHDINLRNFNHDINLSYKVFTRKFFTKNIPQQLLLLPEDSLLWSNHLVEKPYADNFETLQKIKFGLLAKVINDDELMKISYFKQWVDDLILFIKKDQKISSLDKHKKKCMESLKLSNHDNILNKKLRTQISKSLKSDFDILKFIINCMVIFDVNKKSITGVPIINDDNKVFAKQLDRIIMSEGDSNDDVINKVIQLSLDNFIMDNYVYKDSYKF